MNAGQICLAPDYVMLPKNKLDQFVSDAKDNIRNMFPTIKDNDDYTSIINERHFNRLRSYLSEAKQKGCEIIEINPADEDFEQQEHYKIPPTLLINPNDDLKVMQEEIFGPILPIKTYDSFEETINYINQKDRPLGLYYFGSNDEELTTVLEKTTSGGVTVNDVIFHVAQDNAPFGGVGPSGMGSYHGEEGFRNFSHAKTVYTQTKLDSIISVFRPPYGSKAKNALKAQIKP